MSNRKLYIHQNAWCELSNIASDYLIELSELLHFVSLLVFRYNAFPERIPRLMRLVRPSVVVHLELLNDESGVYVISASLIQSIEQSIFSQQRYPNCSNSFSECRMEVWEHIKITKEVYLKTHKNFIQSMELQHAIRQADKEGTYHRFERFGVNIPGDNRLIFTDPQTVNSALREIQLKRLKKHPWLFVKSAWLRKIRWLTNGAKLCARILSAILSKGS